ncbi:hypothetical protein BDB00DRAFT_874069 [Zychaea mexicana]|uniref:uncharacterized protein n=1 Tax=Zychaea mexicana TaxID=64656 RepID=UPI0022FF2B13|nr:uncharacterized protein BDB00DRAFT_874069 [Zychaea mexicana]KAI9491688.1 hypothetical protein BDB00DRAFT_874069 [Zychaea mexicana]
MSRSLAEQHISSIDDLSHAVAGVAHVEKPYEEGRVTIRKMKILKEPEDKEFTEAKAKLEMWTNDRKSLETWTLNWFMYWVTCEVASEKDRCEQGIKKAEVLVEEAQKQLDAANDRIREIEEPHEKLAVDNRSLLKYREELTELLDSVLQDGDFPTEKELKSQVDATKATIEKISEDDEKIEQVIKLLKECDMALLEAIVELRQSNDNKTLSEGQVYFPQAAFDALKSARELYPELPGIPSPVEYRKEADNTGAYYSPMQKYLWDVRHSLDDLIKWCDAKLLEHMDDKAEQIIQLGAKTDEWNLERRRLVREVILSA